MPTQLERLIAAIEELADKELTWSFGIKGVGGEARARYDAMMEAADVVREQIETEEQLRQRFEAWLVAIGKNSVFFGRDHNGVYWSSDNESKWQAWQASQTFTEASK